MDVYAIVTEKIINLLESCSCSWKTSDYAALSTGPSQVMLEPHSRPLARLPRIRSEDAVALIFDGAARQDAALKETNRDWFNHA